MPACGFCSMLPSVFLAEVIVPVDLAYSENCVTFPYSFSFSFFSLVVFARKKEEKNRDGKKGKINFLYHSVAVLLKLRFDKEYVFLFFFPFVFWEMLYKEVQGMI